MDKIVFCPKCATKAVKKDAGIVVSYPFWYCEKCKEEVLISESEDFLNILDEEEII